MEKMTKAEFEELLKKAPPVPIILMGPEFANELDEALLAYFDGRIKCDPKDNAQ